MTNCLFCLKEYVPGRNTNGIYCSNSCQGQHTSKKVIESWLNEPTPERFFTSANQPRIAIRKYLIEKVGCACTRCGWNKKHPNALLPALEIEHIDGNWLNCIPENIDIICPNCHSLTDTYKARNTGKGREYRRKLPQWVVGSNPAGGTN